MITPALREAYLSGHDALLRVALAPGQRLAYPARGTLELDGHESAEDQARLAELAADALDALCELGAEAAGWDEHLHSDLSVTYSIPLRAAP